VVSFSVPPAARIAAGTAPALPPPEDGAAEADAEPLEDAEPLAGAETAGDDPAGEEPAGAEPATEDPAAALDVGALDELDADDEVADDDDDDDDVVCPVLHPATRRTAPAAAMRAVRR
jgi:hypothetical protein